MTPFGGRGGLVPASDPDLTAVKRWILTVNRLGVECQKPWRLPR